MTRIARDANRIYIGNDHGFVPVEKTSLGATPMKKLLGLAASNSLPPIEEAFASPIQNSHISFRSPIQDYGKLWGIGLNYAEHADDLNEERPTEPGSFMKPSTSAIGPIDPIKLPPTKISNRVTAEAELGVVIGQACSNISQDEVDDVIAGYVPIIDMTAEDILEKNPRYLTRAKSFDNFIVIGPWIKTPDVIGNLLDIEVKTVINGKTKAQNTLQNMLHRPKKLVSYHSNVMTLEPGDIISTGTPGAHIISSGDRVEAKIDDVGTICSKVI